MTLPNLAPCAKPDCRAPITHWHDSAGNVFACYIEMHGEPCTHDDPACFAPRETAPLHLPNRAALAGWLLGPLTTFKRSGTPGGEFQIADEVTRFLTKYTHHWVPVEPGTLIKEGTRYRHECENGEAVECIAAGDFFIGNSASFYVLHTVPTPTLTERIRAALNDSPESTISLEVADVEALLDMAGGEDK